MSEAANAPGTKKKPVRKAKVQVAQAASGTLELKQTYLGEVRPRLEATLAAGASGEVRSIEVREGTRVSQGQTLVTIDTNLVSAQIRQAQAARERLVEERAQAKREVARIEALGPDVTPQIQAERERSRARALDAAIASQDAVLRRSRAERARHKVVAPFDGVVTGRLGDPGDWVGPGTPILELVDPASVEVFVPVPATLTDAVRVGDEVTLRGRRAHTKGQVIGVVPALEPTTRTLTLRIAPAKKVEWLLPGDAVDCEVSVKASSEGVRVPRDAIVRGVVGTKVVLVGEGDKAVSVDVQILTGTNEEVLLLANEKLSPGVRVVTRGNERLRPGQDLEVLTNVKPEESSP